MLIKISFIATLVFLPLMQGCSPVHQQEDAAFFANQSIANSSKAVLHEGISDVIYFHLNPKTPRDMVEKALHGVINQSKIIELVSTTNDLILRKKDGNIITAYRKPQPQQVYEWVELANNIIEDALKNDEELAKAGRESVNKVFFNTLLKSLDPHSRYADPFEATVNKMIRGGNNLGLLVLKNDNKILVDKILQHGAANQSGLKVNDEIIAINGKILQTLDITSIYSLLYNTKGALTLTIRRSENNPFDITIEQSKRLDNTVKVTLVENFLFINIKSFNETTTHQLLDKLDTYFKDNKKNIQGIVLDLQDNPGGLLISAVEIADLFLDYGVISNVRGRHPQSYQIFQAKAGDLFNNIPVVILINKNTASAAEILTAALKDNKRAVVLGYSSYGKGTVQTIPSLSNQAEMSITWANFFAPSGKQINQIGITPDLCLNNVRDGFPNNTLLLDNDEQALIKAKCFQGKANNASTESVAIHILKNQEFYELLLKQ